MCLTCGRFGVDSVCQRCRVRLSSPRERFVAGVGPVRSAFDHQDVARVLVHHLKYRGVSLAGAVLAQAMVPLIDRDVVLVPVPRTRWRLYRFGVDPALELALAIARITGLRVERCLVPPWMGPSRARGARRWQPSFAPKPRHSGAPAVLVDDVVTTGSTLRAAAGGVDRVVGAVTATSA